MSDDVDSWYSWVVVGVGFVMNFIGYGILRLAGLFYSDIINYYNVDREQAATPFLMGSVARAISGPVCGYLSHTLGFRFAITVGSVLAALGIFACSFAQDITALCVFWSIYGFGYGMTTSIYPRVVNLYCKKHATKSNGISRTGSSIAGITLPPLTVVLLSVYGMPGTLLILSAIMLNTIPAVMLLRDPNSKHITDRPRTNEKLCENFDEEKREQKSMEETTFKDKEGLRSNDERTVDINDSYFNKCETSNGNSLDTAINRDLKIPLDKPISRRQKYLKVLCIFWDPVFVTFSIVKCFCSLLYITVPTILVDFSIDKGVLINQATYVLIAYSVGDLFGKAGLGWITDNNYVSRVKYVCLCFAIIASSFCVMVWSNGVLTMTVGVLLVATSNATIATAIDVMFREFFPKEKQSMAMASSEIFLLPMCFGTAPLIGYFRDNLGSYDGLAYCFGGSSLVISGIVLLLPIISKWMTSEKRTWNI